MSDASDGGPSPSKGDLRTEMRRARNDVPDRHHRSQLIWDAVVPVCNDYAARLHPAGPLKVLAFVGVGSEPETGGLIEQFITSGFSVLLPRIDDQDIVAVGYGPGHDLAPGAFGIPVPAGPGIDPALLDVVIVPGLAFATDGHRLGQGGGYYDRFLPRLRRACLTIGVCFREQLVDAVPVEDHDHRVDMVISDAPNSEQPVGGDVAE
ncbi:MAG TPA: 5-formyltetrahydrofolate cyclo-ligase [Ilumatobacteraceae bacterium]|jgi:5-formyltetrahydrofolate cyclo-ligase